VHLTERFHGKEVFLVGTVNLSTMLAQRTRNLIKEVKPDAVMVQTNQRWWETAKLLGYVDSQEEFNLYQKHLAKYSILNSFNYWKQTNRTLLFWARFYTYCATFVMHYRLPWNWHFLRPGLEIKFACEEAEKQNAQLHFLGHEFDQTTWNRLLHETRMNLPQYIWKRFVYWGHHSWEYEKYENRMKAQNCEPHQYAEKVCDPYMINWYIQSMDIYFPKFKSIFIDKRDQDLFRAIDSCKEKRVVAVVNQWHMEGIEHEWAHRYGQVPRSVHFPEGINPIGDMDLRNGLFQRMYNALHREVSSAHQLSTPSTYADWIIGYHRESNWQYEHRDM